MDLLDFPLNNMKLRISKNFGFVKTFNFYLFPNLNDGVLTRLRNIPLSEFQIPKLVFKISPGLKLMTFNPAMNCI